MKGQAKRFVNQRGELYEIDKAGKKIKERDVTRNVKERENVGFFDLWRYATVLERAMTALGVLFAWLCSGGLAAAVLAYGEVTSLLVLRHNGEAAQGRAPLLSIFGGGEYVQSPNRSDHMSALVSDSAAFGLASLAVMAAQLCAAAAAVVLADCAASSMVARLRVRLFRSALRQEMAFYDTDSTMNFVTMITEDMERLRAGAGQHVAMCGYLCGAVASASALAAAYGWQLTLVGLAFVPLSVAVAAVVAKYQTRFSSREAAAYGTAGRIVEETLAALRTVRAYGGEQEEVKRYVSALAPAGRWARARGLAAGAGAGGGWLLTYSLNAAVFAYGTQLCVRDLPLPPEQREYHPGVMVTVLFCTFMAAQNVAMCHPHLEVFSAARGAASAIYRLLERTSKIDSLGEDGERPDKIEGDIKFENVYFNYPSRPDVKVLRGFSLHISPGETVALVGGSGSGKSTALQLLQRLYDAGDGTVAVDGRDVRTLHLHSYRTRIGVVGQEPVLFSGTIRENITLGLDDVTQEQLEEAAKTAHAHQFITKLDKGYDTLLGGGSAGGAQLSGGQKQRIAIARAVLRRPPILLLDEPTSALDPAAEKQVQAALDAASVGRTTVVVSHRLSTIVKATRIVYMEQGAALEQGTYEELVEKKGLFWTLLQADLTTKNMEASENAAIQEEEEEVTTEEKDEPLETFMREFKRRDTIRESTSPERLVRGSRRLGAACLAPLAASEVTLEESPEDPQDDLLPASTWALLRLNAPERGLLVAGGLASLAIGATMPAFALLFSKLYGMFTWSDPAAILAQSRIYAGLFLFVAALCGLVTFLQAWLLQRAGARLTDRLRKLTFTSYLRQEQAWFDQPSNSVGALCARLATDCAAVQGATGTRLGAMMQGISTMLIGVTLAMVYSWKMTLVSLISVPCVMGGIYLESVVSRRSAAAARRALEGAARVAAEAVMNLRTVQSLGVEDRLANRFASSLPRASLSGRLVRGAVYGLCLCAPTLGYAVSLAYGGYLVAREGMPLEYTILVSEALIYGAWMLAEALSFAPNFSAAKRAGARVLQVMTREPAVREPEEPAVDGAWTTSGEISLNGVHFSYPGRAGCAVLRGLTLAVRAGQAAALVGASGCGKSTVLQLLLRLYDPDSGTITLDGVDIRQLPLGTLRAQLGLVQQEPCLFSRPIRDNIAYGAVDKTLDTEQVIEAATKANVHQFIASLPAGYETNLGSGGAQLSGGQKQRIAIARALARDPKILLLDEATSALDAASEKSVQEALQAAARGRSVLLVAHRLATVRHADVIYVIDKGVVAESGSHEELLRKRGHYFELWQQQSSN